MQLVRSSILHCLALSLLLCAASTRAQTSDCDNGEFDSTFALIQKAIFENRGCTDSLCHGDARSGGLDLRAGVSHANLIDVPAQTVEGATRVLPGQTDRSLLYINLAAGTFPELWTAPLRAMPLSLPPLSPNELEAVRLWVQAGAPSEGVVTGTAELLDACLPPPGPIAITPLPPPAPGSGVQLKMPRWILPAQSEDEVCFASYYDVSGQVPPEYLSPDGTSFRYHRSQVRQDPLSHHLIINLYSGRADPHSPQWGEFKCRGGAKEGTPCDPLDLGFCGEESGCATAPVSSVACIGVGPADSGLGLQSAGTTIVQETAEQFDLAPGVFKELPLRGMILWNSHAFNLTDDDGKLEAWANFEFAPPEQQEIQARQLFDAEEIFKMRVPAFATEEVCRVHVFAPNTHLFELTSHTHRRGKRFRIYRGSWTCDGQAGGFACSPLGYDLVSPDPCPGRCQSVTAPRVGDCNYNGTVSVDELVTGVSIALGGAAISECRDADVNQDSAVFVDELIIAVNAALNGVPPGEPRDPEESLIYTNLVYNDPVVLRMDEDPVVFSGPTSERSLTFCALYDNGFTNTEEVKRRSTSPEPPPLAGFPISLGGPCATPTHCTEGRVRDACSGATLEERHRSCDSSAGAADGSCDACPLLGGVTTEDEMFIMYGQFYVP